MIRFSAEVVTKNLSKLAIELMAQSADEESKSSDPSALRNLYYGSHRVFFKPCKGSTFALKPNTDAFTSRSDDAAVLKVKQRRFPQKHLGADYSHLLLPSMPCTDITISNQEHLDSDSDGFLFKSPLIKTKRSDPAVDESIIAFRSGIRSALIAVPVDDESDTKMNDDDDDAENEDDEHCGSNPTAVDLYRLKGCGNNDVGYFPFQCIEEGQSPMVEIRGCCFEHTAFRELKMTKDIECILTESGLPSANSSCGWYQYDIDTHCTSVLRICSIFKTKGNKRLGDHLLLGLMRILPIIVDLDALDIDSIYGAFPELRKQELSTYKVMETYLAVLCELELVDLRTESLKEIRIPLRSEIDSEIMGMEWLLGPNQGDNALHTLWSQQCKEYNATIKECDDGEIDRMLIDIYDRLGCESGLILKVIHDDGISWGTYSDALGTHCNAHANNYVLLPLHEFMESQCCLAPLDFDMAFYEKEYIQDKDAEALDEDGDHGQDLETKGKTQETFKELLVMEWNANRASMSGDPEISTGVHWKAEKGKGSYPYRNADERNASNLINWTLKDTLIASFDAAYGGKENKYSNNKFKWSEAKQKLMYIVFNLAIIATSNVIA